MGLYATSRTPSNVTPVKGLSCAWFDGMQAGSARLAVRAPHPCDGIRAATRPPRNRGDGVVRIGEQDDQTVAVDIRRRGPEPQMIEFVPLSLRQFDAVSYGDLPAAPPPVPRSSESRKLDESFCVPT